MKIRRLTAIARKESLHIIRDWRSLVLALAIPVLLICLYGYALDMDLNEVPTIIWDQSETPQSRELIGYFDGSPYFNVRPASSYLDIQDALNRRKALLAIVIPRDFPESISRNTAAEIQVIADASDTNNAQLGLGYVRNIALIYNSHLRASLADLTRDPAEQPRFQLEPRAWYNPELRSTHVIVPGTIALVMAIIAALLTSVTMAREWETGTMEQLISSPVEPFELIFGKVLPYFLIGLADVIIAVSVGRWGFGVPFRGNPALLFALASLFLSGVLFYGLFLSIALKSQVIASQVGLLSTYLPTLLLSGFVFAIADMPIPIQWLTHIVPGRYFITVLRGIYLKGIGLEILWLDALLLLCFAMLMILLARKRLKMKLE